MTMLRIDNLEILNLKEVKKREVCVWYNTQYSMQYTGYQEEVSKLRCKLLNIQFHFSQILWAIKQTRPRVPFNYAAKNLSVREVLRLWAD